MLKIYYSPYYQGNVYRGLSYEDDILLDKMAVESRGLVGHMQLLFGLHHEALSSTERLTRYYCALKRWLEAHPDNELSEPFKVSGLDVARRCLQWRDELLLCGWSAESAAPSDRLRALQGVEQHAHIPSLADDIKEVTAAIELSPADSCADITLAMPCEADLLHPALRNMVGTMVRHGAKIEKNDPCEIVYRVDESLLNDPNYEGLPARKSNLTLIKEMLSGECKEKITLDPEDESFLIYDFADERQAAQYMAVTAGRNPYSLWINADNKAVDNWLRSIGKPAIGSSTPDTVPQVAQLLVLGIGLFARPINIHTLLDWLQPEIHPLGGRFRHALGDAIASQGGYNNDACREVIANYLKGAYAKADPKDAELSPEALEKKLARQRKERDDLLRLYLPLEDNTTLADGEDDVEQVRAFVTALESWAKTRAHLMAEDDNGNLWVAQLHTLAEMSHALLLLLEDVQTSAIPHSLLANWAGALFRSEQYPQYHAELGGQYTITSPGSMTAAANDAVWWNVEGDDPKDLCCAFLMPSERKALEGEVHFWETDRENALRQQAMLTPITHTSYMLTVTRCERRGGEPTQKHPLLVRIENQVTNWDKFVRRPNLHDERWEEVDRTCNETGMKEITFSNTGKVWWPDHLSATTIDTLIQWPLDYVMERMLGLQETGPSALPELRTAKGNVAHAVIERLFAPREEGEKPAAGIIRERIETEYDTVFKEMLQAYGAMLYLPENQLEAKLLKEQLATSLHNLAGIIGQNSLRVTACEHFVKGHLGVLSADTETKDVQGYIDMTLEDEGAHPVVFDFKWTSSRKYYQGLLTKNESIQLQLYRRMLSDECRDEVRRVGYFLMPDARLYSTEPFDGPNCVRIEPENTDDLLEKVRRSVEYRLQQIAGGVIENGDGKEISTLPYATDAGAGQRVPLKASEEGVHDGNQFSKYNLFKR